MRKNDAPHEIFFELKLQDSERSVLKSYCTCKAGLGKCVHLVGVFYYVNHLILMRYEEISQEATCTSVEQQWHKPRGKKINPAPLMEEIFAKPNPKRKKEPIMCSLKGFKDKTPPTVEEIQLLSTKLKEHNPDFPLSYLLNTQKREMHEVPMGIVPHGSTLSFQTKTFCPHKESISSEDNIINYPSLPLDVLEPVDDEFEVIEGTKLTLEEAIRIEKETVGQNNYIWHEQRKIRLTASNFGVICKRKKAVNTNFLRVLQEGQNLNNVKAVHYGKINEHKALDAYKKYMNSVGQNVIILPSGLVINPAIPFLGCSPDGKVYDKKGCPEFGLVEVKCPMSKKGMSLNDLDKDKNFYCTILEGKIHLKTNTNHYYQVQGQMYLCGVQWCDFVVYNGNDVWVERVKKDVNFCEEMIETLCQFYKKHFYDHISKLPVQSIGNVK